MSKRRKCKQVGKKLVKGLKDLTNEAEGIFTSSDVDSDDSDDEPRGMLYWATIPVPLKLVYACYA